VIFLFHHKIYARDDMYTLCLNYVSENIPPLACYNLHITSILLNSAATCKTFHSCCNLVVNVVAVNNTKNSIQIIITKFPLWLSTRNHQNRFMYIEVIARQTFLRVYWYSLKFKCMCSAVQPQWVVVASIYLLDHKVFCCVPGLPLDCSPKN